MDKEMPQNIAFVNDLNQSSGVTFVNYGSTAGSNAYRREARVHNAVRGRHSSNRNRLQRTEQSRGLPAAETRLALASSRPRTILDPLSTYARDPFSSNLTSLTQDLEAVWRSAFQGHFFLPRMRSASTYIPDPEDSFLTAARGSRHAYRNIVTLKVVTSEAKKGNALVESVFYNQALILQEFRRLIDRYNASNIQLTRGEFQDIFTTAFSFFGHDFGKEPAYNAIIFVNSTLMLKPENLTMRQLPVVEWVRMLMPRPGLCFHRSQSYQSLMLMKINGLLDSLERAQDNALSSFTCRITSRHFHPATSLYRIVTTRLPERIDTEPYPTFYLMCFHRILFLIHVHIDQTCRGEIFSDENDEFLNTLEIVASQCLQFEPPQRIALFLWGLLVNADAQAKCRDEREQFYTWAMKDLHTVGHLDFIDAMVSWLLYQVELDDQNVARLDFAQIKAKMQIHYEPN